jgi:hypothetical protein
LYYEAFNSQDTPSPYRTSIQGGDFFVGGVVAGTLTKLMLRLKALNAISGEWWTQALKRRRLLV